MKLSSLNKGLVGSWNLDSESMKSSVIFGDKTPNNNDGVSANAPVFVADRFGNTRAMQFNGTTDDNVRIPDSESLSPTSAMTVMAWVKGAAQNNKVIFSHSDGGLDQIGFYIVSNYISPYNQSRVYLSDNGTGDSGHRKVYVSSIVALDSTWHLIGFSFNAGTLKLYTDGIEDTNPTKTYDDAITTIHNSTADIMVGCYLNSDAPTGFFDGDLAKPRMWNRALTDAEWLTAYEQYNPRIVI